MKGVDPAQLVQVEAVPEQVSQGKEHAKKLFSKNKSYNLLAHVFDESIKDPGGQPGQQVSL